MISKHLCFVLVWTMLHLWSNWCTAWCPAIPSERNIAHGCRFAGRPAITTAFKLRSSRTAEGDESSMMAKDSLLIDPQERTDSVVVSTSTSHVHDKFVNGVFLAASFGYAAFAILNIDQGMTRGWTQSEIAMRIPLDTWSSYESSLAESPVLTKTLINVVIYLLGDWLSQTVFQGKNVLEFDMLRTIRNGFIGLCFGPIVHQYYQWSDHVLPVEAGLWNRLGKILMDQTIYLTVKCSIYIAAVGLLQGDDLKTVSQSVKGKIGGICVTAWKFWPIVHLITYNFIPARHRILWVNSVDLVWNAILATQTQKDAEEAIGKPESEMEPLLMAPSDREYVRVLETEPPTVSRPLSQRGDSTSTSAGTNARLFLD